ncbi:D-inositol-3-phosphate glycosyltransferase [Abditibacteriota bacterium]|nr:D-inositol-3-phosphate glycosyltransferase [Abditibacteriota bacterium]
MRAFGPCFHTHHVKIALDATPLYGRLGGIERALWQTLLALHELDLPHSFEVFVPQDAPASPLTKENWHWRRLPFEGAAKGRRIVWQQVKLPLLLKSENFDGLHATNYVMPLLSPCKTVVSIPDLIALDFPRFATRANRLHYRAVLPATLRHADVLLASTPHGCDAILRRAPKANVVVAALGVEDEFFEPISESECLAVREKFKLPPQFLLFAGNLEPKKNLPRLLRAVEALGNEAPELIFVGALKPWPELQQLKLRTRSLGYVERTELRALMSACVAFCFPSLIEGFGLPVLEALACGANVVASTRVPIPGLKQVAWTPQPRSVDSITVSIRAALNAADFVSVAGREFAREFSWQKTARIIAGVYDSL